MDNKFDISSEPVNSWYMIKKTQFLVICAKRSFGHQIRVIGLQIICNDYDVQQKGFKKTWKIDCYFARMQKEMFKKCVVES